MMIWLNDAKLIYEHIVHFFSFYKKELWDEIQVGPRISKSQFMYKSQHWLILDGLLINKDAR